MAEASRTNKFVLNATTDRKKLFRERVRAKIRDAIGTSNRDQDNKEALLIEICSKITSAYIRTLECIENSLGKETWGHDIPFAIFQHLPPEQQLNFKKNASLWLDAKAISAAYVDKQVIEICRAINECTTIDRKKFNERQERTDQERKSRTDNYLGKPVRDR
jgi:hypothetical protein